MFFAFSDRDSTFSLVPAEWSITVFKVGALFFVFAISIAGSFLPLRLSSLSAGKRSFITAASRCFAAGVFLGVGLLHMLPESDKGIREAGWGKLPDGREFPLAFGMATLGFVVVWLLERHGEALWGPDKQRMLAVATQAEKFGGGSICYVQVETVASYGPVVCRSGVPLPTFPQGVETLRSPMLPPVSVSEIDTPVQREYVRVPDEPEGFPVITSIADDETLDAARGKKHLHSRTGQSQTKKYFQELFQHVQGFSTQKLGGSMRSVSEDTRHVHSGHGCQDNKEEEDHTHGSECLSGRSILCQSSIAVEAIAASEENVESWHHNLRKSLSEPHSSSTRSGLQENVSDKHSHDWGQGSDVRSGSNSDQCPALHQHSHGAHHQHIVLDASGSGTMSIMLAALLSVHSFVVGAALGSSSTLDGTLSLLIALVAHKGAEAFSVGLQFVREEVPLTKAIGVMLLYCAMTPLGIVLGMAALLLQGPAGALVADLVQAFGAGTVLYVVMHQLAEHGESKNFNGLLEGVLLLTGVFLMFAVTIFS